MKWIVFFLQLVFSFTRVIAASLIKSGVIHSLGTILIWNAAFYITIVASFLFAIFHPVDFGMYDATIAKLATVATLVRINELVMAFYGDALAKKSESNGSRLPIDTSGRIILLTLAYLEMIAQFAIMYYALQAWFGGSTFTRSFQSILDALYFSGMTITTTGYGDFVPNQIGARLAAVYEALIGVVFIALALAAYIGGRDASSPHGIAPSPRTR